LAKNTPVIKSSADKNFVNVIVSFKNIMAAMVAKKGCEYIKDPAILAPSL
jgi:hypothetical protein